MEEQEKKSVANILIDRFIKDIDEKGSLPWQRPYECYNAFNYFSKQPYRGFNRLLLPFGEYMTANQINTYNREHKEDFRFQPGIKWYPISFFKHDKKPCTLQEVEEALPDRDITGSKDGFIGYNHGYSYYKSDGRYIKSRNVLQYYRVADRTYFKNSKGEMLPSRLETGEVEIELAEPKKVIQDYIDRSGVKVQKDHVGVPCYIPSMDLVQLNPYTKDEESWFSTAFHEFAHSTGASSRLNRIGITHEGMKPEDKKNVYAVEECIAEITAYLCCAECGVYDFKTSGTMEYDNSIAYVQAWKSRIQDWGKDFLYICSQADAAFNYILNEEI